jgi:hypothetical protein
MKAEVARLQAMKATQVCVMIVVRGLWSADYMYPFSSSFCSCSRSWHISLSRFDPILQAEHPHRDNLERDKDGATEQDAAMRRLLPSDAAIRLADTLGSMGDWGISDDEEAEQPETLARMASGSAKNPW